jgi:hypothetical protein
MFLMLLPLHIFLLIQYWRLFASLLQRGLKASSLAIVIHLLGGFISDQMMRGFMFSSFPRLAAIIAPFSMLFYMLGYSILYKILYTHKRGKRLQKDVEI